MTQPAGKEPAAELEVVFVCTGNRFRSPLAAALFAQAARELPVHVASAGTLDVGSPPAFPEALEHATRFGLDVSSHRARPLAQADLRRADLVVGFERSHLAAAVVEAGADRSRAFTLPELVELLELERCDSTTADPVSRALSAIRRAHNARVERDRQAGFPEVADPVGGPASVYKRTANEIRDLVDRLARGLFS
jgi:protein-tyrosine phosphatase